MAALDGIIRGTLQDKEDWLAKNQDRLALEFFDTWESEGCEIHSYTSRLERKPFLEADGSPSCAVHFFITPY